MRTPYGGLQKKQAQLGVPMDLRVLIIDGEGRELSSSLMRNLTPLQAESVIKRVEQVVNRNARYDFLAMKVGEVRKIDSSDGTNKIRSAAYMTARRYGWRFQCEVLTNNFVRVTRLS
jgi:hypothetical protein